MRSHKLQLFLLFSPHAQQLRLPCGLALHSEITPRREGRGASRWCGAAGRHLGEFLLVFFSELGKGGGMGLRGTALVAHGHLQVSLRSGCL